MFDFYKGKETDIKRPSRGVNVAYTQLSFWDWTSSSQPFFDTNYKPAFFVLYQKLFNKNLNWVNRIDLEGGYQHHSNGRDGAESRSTEYLYFKPTFVWRVFDNSYVYLAPRLTHYFYVHDTNADVADYWGHVNIELTWRADFGLQLETHTVPAKNVLSFETMVTYPLSNLWRPINFYFFTLYEIGAGQSFLVYDQLGQSIVFGFSLSR